MRERDAYHELCAYSLSHGGATFIHQHVVDAFAAQTADSATKPIALTFALVGLYLHVNRHFTGRQVQRAHQFLGRRKRVWPAFTLPPTRGSITAFDVLARRSGVERDEAIHAWSSSVWQAFAENEPLITDLLFGYGEVFAAGSFTT